MSEEQDSGSARPYGATELPSGGPTPAGYQPPGYGQPGYGPPQAPPGAPYGWTPPPGHGYPTPVAQKNSEKAIIVLAAGAGSIVAFFTVVVGFIPAIVALVMAPGAKREIEQSRGTLGGAGLVTAGVICAWITIALSILAIIAVVLLFSFVTTFTWSFGDATF